VTLTRETPRRDTSRRDPTAPWRHFDPVLVVCSTAIAALGAVMVFSATRGNGPEPDTVWVRRQVMYVVVGFALMLATAAIDYRRYQQYWYVFYLGACALLAAVLSPLGRSVRGAQAWFDLGIVELQPSEVSKVCLIVGLGAVLTRWRGQINAGRLGVAMVMAAIPMALIMRQPDLGTALVFIAIVGAMLLVGGVRLVHMAVLVVAGVVLVAGVLRSDVLKDYQKDRLAVFLDPSRGKANEGYNLNQSIIAISRGGLSGDGLFQGKQTQLRFVPEQQTDFIFTVVAEELGFVGTASYLGLMALVLWRVWRSAVIARDQFGRLLCTGVLAMLAFQVFESVGMTTGIMPVTGIPLPLMSYGGSTTLTTFVAIGLVLNVHMRRFR
jgi:rod shape determining protein RodA